MLVEDTVVVVVLLVVAEDDRGTLQLTRSTRYRGCDADGRSLRQLASFLCSDRGFGSDWSLLSRLFCTLDGDHWAFTGHHPSFLCWGRFSPEQNTVKPGVEKVKASTITHGGQLQPMTSRARLLGYGRPATLNFLNYQARTERVVGLSLGKQSESPRRRSTSCAWLLISYFHGIVDGLFGV